ncbi:hypothetical protein BH10BAC5_BH10BAC5_27750 [soil metagenome]
MNLLNFFKKESSGSNPASRRRFIRTSIAAALGATTLASTTDLFAMKSKTGLIYVKENGEIINNYKLSPNASQNFLGELMCVGYNFQTNGWALCNGQILSIAQNTALFSLLGTTYGGNGQTNFALPDLRGRVPMHFGQGPGLQNYSLGQTGGTETETLITSQLPVHNHGVNVNTAIGTSNAPNGNFSAQNAEGINEYSATSNSTMNTGAIGNSGGGQAHNNMQPYLVMNWQIALQGIFPSQG